MLTSRSVLFVGVDLCARTHVLVSLGYQVIRCECDAQAVREALAQAAEVEAVIFQCSPEPPSSLLLATARHLTAAPLVLFADGYSSYNPRDFDSVVTALCSPRDWLPQIAEVIAANRLKRAPKPPQVERVAVGRELYDDARKG